MEKGQPVSLDAGLAGWSQRGRGCHQPDGSVQVGSPGLAKDPWEAPHILSCWFHLLYVV